MLAAHHSRSQHNYTQPYVTCLSFADPENELRLQPRLLFLFAQMSMKCNACLDSLQPPWVSACRYGELTTAFLQVIPYVAELLTKVHEQQAQAERIVGFQSLFKCVY